MIRGLILAIVMFAVGAAGAVALHQARTSASAPSVGTGPAPGFELTAANGRAFALEDLRSKVVVLSFAFTACTDICPVAIHKFAWMQEELGPQFGADVQFVTITLDPEHDTAEVLAEYADRIGADPRGWSFLTGSPARIREITDRYGVYARSNDEGVVEHILLTSLIDRDGVIRTQYLGERFSAKEMLGDLRALIAGGSPA